MRRTWKWNSSSAEGMVPPEKKKRVIQSSSPLSCTSTKAGCKCMDADLQGCQHEVFWHTLGVAALLPLHMHMQASGRLRPEV